MIVSLPKTVRRLYMMIMFVALSYLLYYALSLLGEWLSPIEDYGIPEGSAVRAFHDGEPVTRSDDGLNTRQRLRFYYWFGE
ncbi:DUF4227 family protein [Paenibacillus monticola]|uniref:DUF4227 family protein n=1 Tax=Paenibacillus monticola TaxID=2666075 RepID=A0A7X2L2M1_9BACL|nr:DUF4227 family protein [Paenibacillus monticola]MRN53511.1 DUF4227 family protein [Paenibacillus monticola]